MTANGWLQIGFFLLVILAITKPIGLFMARVFNREKTFLDFALRPVERLTYRLCGIREDHEMRWTEYGAAMLLFSAVSMILVYLIERTQHWLAFNPQGLANVAPDLAWNTASSFTTKHQLAVLRSRNHHELSDADGRVGVSQLRVGSDGHRAGHCSDPRRREA